MKPCDPFAGERDAEKNQGRGDFLQADQGRQIFYQRDGWAASLSGLDPDWRILPLSENCPSEDCGLAVVFVTGDYRCAATDQLQTRRCAASRAA